RGRAPVAEAGPARGRADVARNPGNARGALRDMAAAWRSPLRCSRKPARVDGHHRADDGRFRACRTHARTPAVGPARRGQERRPGGGARRMPRRGVTGLAALCALLGCTSRQALPPPTYPLSATPEASFRAAPPPVLDRRDAWPKVALLE